MPVRSHQSLKLALWRRAWRLYQKLVLTFGENVKVLSYFGASRRTIPDLEEIAGCIYGEHLLHHEAVGVQTLQNQIDTESITWSLFSAKEWRGERRILSKH